MQYYLVHIIKIWYIFPIVNIYTQKNIGENKIYLWQQSCVMKNINYLYIFKLSAIFKYLRSEKSKKKKKKAHLRCTKGYF